MDYLKATDAIYLNDENGNRVAEICFPEIRSGVVDIVHTKVDPSLAGHGIAGELTRETAKRLRADGRKAVLTCPYAVRWFAQHPEYSDVLEEFGR